MNLDFTNLMEWAERYVNRELKAEEFVAINKQLSTDATLKKEWTDAVQFLGMLKEGLGRNIVKSNLKEVAFDFKKESQAKPLLLPMRLWKKYGKMSAVAAGLALVGSFVTFQLATSTSNQNTNSQFISLKREVEHIKSSQAEIKQSINDADKKDENLITGDVVGTGFAISNDGYLATDYHVVENADSIYIQTSEGKYYKAYLVGFDAKNDAAVLKVENKKFRFGKNDIPYTISTVNAGLAQTIYSLGFPQDDALYSEGYISSKSGLGGDQLSYQLDLPANPGQSGSPIFDKNGNVIGMLIGKKTFSTYAAKSQVLLDLISSLPAEYKIQMPAKNQIKQLSRQEQVAKTLDYVIAVRVYKK